MFRINRELAESSLSWSRPSPCHGNGRPIKRRNLVTLTLADRRRTVLQRIWAPPSLVLAAVAPEPRAERLGIRTERRSSSLKSVRIAPVPTASSRSKARPLHQTRPQSSTLDGGGGWPWRSVGQCCPASPLRHGIHGGRDRDSSSRRGDLSPRRGLGPVEATSGDQPRLAASARAAGLGEDAVIFTPVVPGPSPATPAISTYRAPGMLAASAPPTDGGATRSLAALTTSAGKPASSSRRGVAS